MDIKSLIHVGVEFVVVAGIFAWTNRQVSSVSNKIDATDERVRRLEEQMRMQGSIIMEMEKVLFPSAAAFSRQREAPRAPKEQNFSPVRKPPPPQPVVVEDEEPDVDVLDQMLFGELKELKKESSPSVGEQDAEEIVDLVFEDPKEDKKKV